MLCIDVIFKMPFTGFGSAPAPSFPYVRKLSPHDAAEASGPGIRRGRVPIFGVHLRHGRGAKVRDKWRF